MNPEEILDNLDEIMHTLRPRYINTPSMDGRYPCWVVWLPEDGRCEYKLLKDAVIEAHKQIKKAHEHRPNM